MATEERGKSEEPVDVVVVKRRRSWAQRFLISATFLAVIVLLAVLIGVILYRGGSLDTYVQTRFIERMAEMGIVFDAEAFNLRLNPLELHIRNGRFKDKVTGETLFAVREAHLKMTVKDLWALQASRDITIDTTDISGAEVWIKFDAN